jgi:hypothetical protein
MTFTDAQINEFKEKVSELFMDKFYEFIDDVKETRGDGKDFAWKYGFTIRPKFIEKWTKNTMTNANKFASQVFNGGTIDFWMNNGLEKEMIWKLVSEGFLSESTAWKSGSKTFYFLKQDIIKEIFKQYRR